MAVALGQVDTYTPEEYLALEERADYKSEYCQGTIYPMSGSSVNHGRIVGGIVSICHLGLRGTGCEVFNNVLRLQIKSNGLFTYPDIMLVCGRPEMYKDRDDTITNPVVIFEVLSESTRDYDRGLKFELYRGVPSLREYVVVHQDTVHIEHYHRLDLNRWLLTEIRDLDAALVLNAVELALPVRDIYERVDWLAA